MKCSLDNSLNRAYFGKKQDVNLKNAPLSFEPIVPTSKLPNASIYDKINSNTAFKTPHNVNLSKEDKLNKTSKGSSTSSLGKLSAACAGLGMLLSAVSLLLITRKK